jgi:hypothetical protein
LGACGVMDLVRTISSSSLTRPTTFERRHHSPPYNTCFITICEGYIQMTFFLGTFIVLKFCPLMFSSNQTCFECAKIISYNLQKDLFNDIRYDSIENHLTLILKGFVVKNQIFNLTPNFSFNCNSCILGLNKQCNYILNIYTLKPFQWCLGGPNLCSFALLIKRLNIWDSCTSATPKVRVHLGIIGVHSLAPSPTCESLFHSQTNFLGFMCSCIPCLVVNLM